MLMVRENRSAIYTVCYMFSNDQDEVADLFQEVLAWPPMPPASSHIQNFFHVVSA